MLLTALLIGLFATARHDGPVRRWLVEIPAERLSAMTPGNAVALMLLLAIAPFAGQVLLPEMAWILALDLAAWVEVGIAATVMARLVPAWKGLRGGVVRLARAAFRPAGRARRSPALSRKPAKPPEPEDGWAFA